MSASVRSSAGSQGRKSLAPVDFSPAAVCVPGSRGSRVRSFETSDDESIRLQIRDSPTPSDVLPPEASGSPVNGDMRQERGVSPSEIPGFQSSKQRVSEWQQDASAFAGLGSPVRDFPELRRSGRLPALSDRNVNESAASTSSLLNVPAGISHRVVLGTACVQNADPLRLPDSGQPARGPTTFRAASRVSSVGSADSASRVDAGDRSVSQSPGQRTMRSSAGSRAGSNVSNRGRGGAVAGQGNSAQKGPADGGPTDSPKFSGAAAASQQVQASTAAVAAVENGKRQYARAPPTIGYEVEILCWRENPLRNDRRQYYGIYPGAWLDDVGTTLAGQNPKHLDEVEDLVLREEMRNADTVDEQADKWMQAVDRANKRSHKVKKYRCPWCFWPATLEAHGPHAPNAEDYDVRCHMTGVRGSRRQKPCVKRPEGATGREDLIENKHKLAKLAFSVIAKHMNELEDGVP